MPKQDQAPKIVIFSGQRRCNQLMTIAKRAMTKHLKIGFKPVLSRLPSLIKIQTANSKKPAIKVLSLGIMMALIEAAGIASVMPFLTVLANPTLISENLVFSRINAVLNLTTLQFISVLGMFSFIMTLLAAILRSINYYVSTRYIESQRHLLSEKILRTYLYKPYDFFIEHHTGEMTKTILSEVDHVIAYIIRPTVNLILNVFLLITIITFLILVNPWIALIAGMTFAALFLLSYTILKSRLSKLGEILVENNTARFKVATEALNGIKEIKVLGREEIYLSRFSTYSKNYSQSFSTHMILSHLPKYLIEGIAFGGVIFITLFTMWFNNYDSTKSLANILPVMGLYVFSAYRLQPAFQAIYSAISNLKYGSKIIDDLIKSFDTQNLPVTKTARVPKSTNFQNNIEIKNLTYSYTNSLPPTLKNISLTIQENTSVAFIGQTGAGKTTLIDIIMGLLPVGKDTFYVGGEEIASYNVKKWQQSIGYVPQEIYLFDGTIAENIALGVSNDEVDQAALNRAVDLAQIKGFIEHDLKDGFDTQVGQRGIKLSGGQKQRIAIARALYNNPNILIFDEATSALDEQTEQAVITSIKENLPNKTLIYITHRISTAATCDKIFVLKAGVLTTFNSIESYKEYINDRPQQT